MKITEVTSVEQARNLCEGESPLTGVIFKHSPRCSISRIAWDRFTRYEEVLPHDFPVYVVNVLDARDASQYFAGHFSIEHASPQVLLVRNNACTYHESHNGIDPRVIAEQL
ncbi:MAG TPA: bacillithiol system redox-active protein YtxJ [Bacteroidia bacterium]|nr:bacillithiol system redox-active protein YtxJ [Bacteroidia bacterium]